MTSDIEPDPGFASVPCESIDVEKQEHGFGGVVARHPRLTLAVALLVGLAAPLILRQLPPSAQTLELTPVVKAILADPGSPSAGPRSSEITVVVFTDYRCPICRATDPALDRARVHHPEVRFIYKDWPIFGEASRYAAIVALAADRQGKYVAVHNALMQSRGPLDRTGVRAAAIAAGVDWPRTEADLQTYGTQIDTQLARQATQAWLLGIEGTPAYLVGPLLIRGGMSDAALTHAIAAAHRSPATEAR